MTGLMTELLRISKSSSNDYRCAEVPLGAFNQPATDATKRLIAQSAIFSLHQQIQLDDRLNAFTKKLGTLSQAEMADEMSSMQVERDKIWHSLVPVIEVVLLSLEDDKRLNKNGNIDRLNITLAQKQALAGKVVRLFPGAAGDDPDHMNMPTFLASLYLVLLNGHKAADEA
jgi:hypothetical protein